MTESKNNTLSDRIAVIKQEFLTRMKDEEVPNLRSLSARFRADPTDAVVRTDIRRVTHDLIGSGAVFGYDEISTIGKRVETLLRALLRQEVAEGPEAHGEIATLLDRLTMICAETERDLTPTAG